MDALFADQGMNIISKWDTFNDAIHDSAAECFNSGSATCSVEAESELPTYKDTCQSINGTNYFELPSFSLSCISGESTSSVDVKNIGFCFPQTEACAGLEEDKELLQNHIIGIFSSKNLANCTMNPQYDVPVAGVEDQPKNLNDPARENASQSSTLTATGGLITVFLAFLFAI
ncbi:hypothetical protein ACHAWC_011395 [Mediolabrus comicus]